MEEGVIVQASMKHATALALLAVLAGACSSDDPAVADSGSVSGQAKALRITDQMSGWTEKAGSYVAFDASTFFNLINGGAQPHVDRGLVDGIYQVMTSAAGRNVELYAEDFGTAANAKTMYAFAAKQVVDKLTLSGYGADTALGDSSLGGAVFHATFSRFYFKLILSGYSAAEQKNLLADAAAFVAAYEKLSQNPGG
jgi:hypothetical protein